MAAETHTPTCELEAFAAPFIQSGRYANTNEVLRAAMDALRRETLTDEQENSILEALADEAEASGLADGDIFEKIRSKYGWKPFAE